MGDKKKYWVGAEEFQGSETLRNTQENEFAEKLPVDQFWAIPSSMKRLPIDVTS